MPKISRRNRSAAKVALVSIKGEETLAQLATRFDVHSIRITLWREQLLEHALDGFSGGGLAAEPGPDSKTLRAEIWKLLLDNDFLADALGQVPGSNAKH